MVTIVGKMFKWITVLLCESDSVLLSAERKHHVGQGICAGLGIKKITSDTGFLFWQFKNHDYYDVHSRGGPAHQWVFPAFPGVKIHLPLLGIFDARLHGIAGGHKDTDLAGLNMLLGNASQSCDVLAK